MIIIADSGGSKTDWRLLHADRSIKQVSSPGFNAYYQPIDDLKNAVHHLLLPEVKEDVTKIFFYGSGVSSVRNQLAIKSVFLEYFPESQIEIGWDLLAAARALCGDEAGIACILGTGSNSCLYDGKEITDNVPNLGGSWRTKVLGANIGKKFLLDYIRGKMPGELAKQFQARFPLSREEFLEKIYQQEKPSAFLASFSKFIFQHIKDPYCYKLVYSGFSEFYENNVMEYKGYQNLKVHFTGSVAFYFSDVLRQVANDKGITVKNILEGPIAGLTLYHKEDIQ